MVLNKKFYKVFLFLVCMDCDSGVQIRRVVTPGQGTLFPRAEIPEHDMVKDVSVEFGVAPRDVDGQMTFDQIDRYVPSGSDADDGGKPYDKA